MFSALRFLFNFLSVTLSLEAKLHLLHTYMNVTWIPLPCEVQVSHLHDTILHSAEVIFVHRISELIIFDH